MEREILFRGKRTDNGEWVYGIPARFRKVDNIVRVTMIPEIDSEHIMSECVCVEPDTVEQFTGMLDRSQNRTRIFEGDIIDFRIPGDYVGDVYIPCNVVHFGVVRYAYGEFTVHSPHSKGKVYGLFSVVAEYCAKVIGNVHDSPEMLG